MKMTKDQAATYCHEMAQRSLDGTPRGEEKSILWSRLHDELDQDGLEVVEERCEKWQVDHPVRSATWTLYSTFLGILSDEEEIERAIARTLIVKIHEEIEAKASLPLRSYYLSCFRNHLENVLNGSMNLGDYEVAREGIEAQLMAFEEEYGAWIDEALEAQE